MTEPQTQATMHQHSSVEGAGGVFRVRLSWYRAEKSAKRWMVELSVEREPKRFLGFVLPRFMQPDRWHCLKRHLAISRLAKAREIYEQMKAEAERRARGVKPIGAMGGTT